MLQNFECRQRRRWRRIQNFAPLTKTVSRTLQMLQKTIVGCVGWFYDKKIMIFTHSPVRWFCVNYFD
eukprot:UN11238